jgi:hypothetical protein
MSNEAQPDNIFLGRTYTLSDRSQVSFRLAGPGDQAAVSAFASSTGEGITELGLARLLHADPRRQAMVCATSLRDGRETMLGFAAASLVDERAVGGEKSLVIVDPQAGPELRELLVQALLGRLRSAAPRRAAG